MLSIAHIIKPVVVSPESDLFVAQPITFASMKAALDFTPQNVKVQIYTAQYPEETPVVPDFALLTPDLERSVLDIRQFPTQRKLPILRDILDRLYASAPDADYLIYTNVDIAVQPYFYTVIRDFIAEGYDAFTINRRTISSDFNRVEDLPLMYAQVGESHPGYDCFVFKRDAYPRYQLGDVCIGSALVDKALGVNMIYQAARFAEFPNEHLTFHIGDSQTWRSKTMLPYWQHNEIEVKKVLKAYRVFSQPRDFPMIQTLTRLYGPRPLYRSAWEKLNRLVRRVILGRSGR